MANHRTGQYVDCPICGTSYYKSRSDFTNGKKQTCGAPDCKTANMSGERNPFWGRQHSEESRQKIRSGRNANPPKGTGPKKGRFKHTEEAKRKISAASRRLWAEKRDEMLRSLPRGEDCRFHKPPNEKRHRDNFSPRQRREWKESECAYCGDTEELVLDHIIPIFDGGTNQKENCQTLCHACNLWKVYKVDLPRRLAAQAAKGATNNPE